MVEFVKTGTNKLDTRIYIINHDQLEMKWVGFPPIDKGIEYFDHFLKNKIERYKNQLSEGLNLSYRPKGLDKFPDDWKDVGFGEGGGKDLIPTILNVLQQSQWNSTIQSQITKLNDEWVGLPRNNYGDFIRDDDYETADYIFDDLADLMNSLSPDGTYFGTGTDDSYWGFWKIDDEDND